MFWYVRLPQSRLPIPTTSFSNPIASLRFISHEALLTADRAGARPDPQGANMAFDDAWSLAAALAAAAGPDASAAAVRRGLAAYEAQRLAKTSRIVKLSRTLGDVNHSRSAALCWLRDRLTGLMVRSGRLQKQMAAEIAAQPVLPLGPRP